MTNSIFYRDRRANLINSKFASLLFVVRFDGWATEFASQISIAHSQLNFLTAVLLYGVLKRQEFGFTFTNILRYKYPKTFTTTIKISLGKNLKQKNKLSNNAQFDLEF